jgi:hypothetical protein
VNDPVEGQVADPVSDTIALASEQEYLRQVRETFDQRKKQDGRWNALRLVMGWIAVALLPGVAITSGWIIFHNRDFTAATVTVATSALLVDAVGLVISVWRIVLGSGPVALGPVASSPTREHDRTGRLKR